MHKCQSHNSSLEPKHMTSSDYKKCMKLQECKPQQTTHLFITLRQFKRRDSATVMLQNMFSIPVALQTERTLAMSTRGISHLQELKMENKASSTSSKAQELQREIFSRCIDCACGRCKTRLTTLQVSQLNPSFSALVRSRANEKRFAVE